MINHKHTIVRATVKNPFVKVRETRKWLKKLVSNINMVITRHGGPHVDYVKKPDNEGIAAVAMIETSHISLHIWDKQNPALVQMDVYSCSDYDPQIIISSLKEMSPIQIDYMVIDRSKELNVDKITSLHFN